MMMMEKQRDHDDIDFPIFEEDDEKIKNKVSGSRTGAIITNSVITDENEIEESDDFSNKVKIPSNFNVTPFSKKYLLTPTPDQRKSKILSNSQIGVQQDFNFQIEEEEEEKEEVSFVDSKIDQNQRHTLIELSPIQTTTENHAHSMINPKFKPIKTPTKLTSKSAILRQSRKSQIESIPSNNDVVEAVHNARTNKIQPPIISPYKAPEVEESSPQESKTNDPSETTKKYPVFVDQAKVQNKKSIETSPFKKPLNNQNDERNDSFFQSDSNEFNFAAPFEQNQTQQNVKRQSKFFNNSANASTQMNNNNSFFRTDLQQKPFEMNEEVQTQQKESTIEDILAKRQQQPFTKNKNYYSSRLKNKSFDEIPKINEVTMDLYDESKNDDDLFDKFDKFDGKEELSSAYTQNYDDSKKRSYRYKYRTNTSSSDDDDTSFTSSINENYTQSPIISNYSPYRSKPESDKKYEEYFKPKNSSRENITIINRFNQSNSINKKDEFDYFNDYKPAPIQISNEESENQSSYHLNYDNQRKSNGAPNQNFAKPRQKNLFKQFQTYEDSSTSDDDDFLEIENEKNKVEHLDRNPKNDNLTKKIQKQKNNQVKRISVEDYQDENSDSYSEEDNFKKSRSNLHNKFFNNRNNSIIRQKSAKRLHRNENIKINQDYDENSDYDSEEFNFTPPIEQDQKQYETQQRPQPQQQFVQDQSQFQKGQPQYQFQQPQQQFVQDQFQPQYQFQPQQQYQFQQPQQQYQFQPPPSQQQFVQGQFQPQYQFQQLQPQQQFVQDQSQFQQEQLQQQYQFQQPPPPQQFVQDQSQFQQPLQQQQFMQDQSQFQQEEQPQQKENQTELQEEHQQEEQPHPQIELEISQSQIQQQFQESNNSSENEINKETENQETERKEIKLEPFFDTLVSEAPEFRPSTPNVISFKYTAINSSPMIETLQTKSYNDDSQDPIQTDQHFTNDESTRVTNKPNIKRISRGPKAIKSGIFNFNIDKSYTINDDDNENENDNNNGKIGSELLSQIKTPKSILKKRSEDSGIKTENFNTPVKKLRFEKPKDGRQIPHLPISPLPDVNKLMTPVQSKTQNQDDESSDEILFRDSFIDSSMPSEEVFRYEDEKQDFSAEYPFNSFTTPPHKSLTLAEMEQNSIKKVKHRHHRRHRSKQNEENENEDENQISEEKEREEQERLEQEEKRIKKLEEEEEKIKLEQEKLRLEEEARQKQEEDEKIKLEQEKLRLEEEKQKRIQEKEEMLRQEEQRIKMEQERLKREEERLKQQEEMQNQKQQFDEESKQKLRQNDQSQNDESNQVESQTTESAPQSFEEMHNNSFPDYPTISQNNDISSTTSSSPPHSENLIESHSSIVDVSDFHQFNSPSPPPPINDDFDPPALLSSQNSDDEIINDQQQQQLPPPSPFSSQNSDDKPKKQKAAAATKAKPKRNQRIRKTEENSNEKYDPNFDDLPIALRRTMRPKTQPLRHWMNEKIIYKPAENGCFTQYAVQTDLQNSDYIDPLTTSGAQTIESIIEENQRIKNERNKRKSSSSLKNDSEVIPKRIIPGIENPSSSIISFKGIEKRTIKSNEIEILPEKSLELDAAQKKIMVVFSGGDAASIEYKNGKKWKIRAGGQAYICKGDLATITNLSNEESVHLFVIYN